MRKQRFVTLIAFAIFAFGIILLNNWVGQSHTKLAINKKIGTLSVDKSSIKTATRNVVALNNDQQVSNIANAISLTADVTPTTVPPVVYHPTTTTVVVRPTLTYSRPVYTQPIAYSPSGGIWSELRSCESNNNYGDDTGNGYYGAYQFSLSTWESLGYSGLPSNAAPAMQDQAAQRLAQRSGWGQWPVCSVRLGL
jgi:hypothetical protein